MKTFFVCAAAVLGLAACNSQEAAEPVAAQTVAPPPVKPTMPAPDEAVFAEVFAETCPNAEKVSTSICRSHGLGKPGFTCDYGLGDDEYRRNKLELVPVDGKWTVSEPEKVCAAHSAA